MDSTQATGVSFGMKKAFAAVIILGYILAAGFFFPPVTYDTVTSLKPDVPPPAAVETAVRLDISCVGDIMVHSTQYIAQYDKATDSYNFTDNFQYVKPYISQADLALCNVETVFAGGKLSGYPNFNSPDSLAGNLKDTGFDVAIMANNHVLDQGTKGLIRTIDVLKAAGLETSGAQKEGGKSYTIYKADGINIGVISYTYETSKAGGSRSLNGNTIPAAALPLINSFSYNAMDEDMAKIADSISQARQAGAEIIVCYFHWGEEYQRAPNEWQTTMAKAVSDLGADIIFASHPHVLQPAEKLVSAKTGKETAVFYSMGNFISNQRTETLDNRYTEQGIIAEVSLSIMKSTGKISDMTMHVQPIWVDRYKTAKMNYAIIPLDATLKANPTLAKSGHLGRAEQALDDIIKLLGSDYIKE